MPNDDDLEINARAALIIALDDAIEAARKSISDDDISDILRNWADNLPKPMRAPLQKLRALIRNHPFITRNYP